MVLDLFLQAESAWHGPLLVLVFSGFGLGFKDLYRQLCLQRLQRLGG